MGPSIGVLREARHTPVTVFIKFDDDSDSSGEHDPGLIEVNGQQCPAHDGFRTREHVAEAGVCRYVDRWYLTRLARRRSGVYGRAQLNLTFEGIAVCG